MKGKSRVIVGMSGGVDSSVAAYLLKQQGYDVVGLFMRNWNDASVTLEDECPWIDDSRDAMLVADQLGIPFQVIDMSEVYKERIVDYMFHEYQIGRTPNPDVLCNREIKFDLFLEEALKLGADFVGTGHYVRKGVVLGESGTEEFQLLRGLDSNKDQSYFLCQLNQFQLSKALFPIGELQKSEVRKIAEEIGLVTAYKKDSQGLCFIGKVSLPEFLQQKLEVKKGEVYEIASDDSSVLEYKELVFGGIEDVIKKPNTGASESLNEVVVNNNGNHALESVELVDFKIHLAKLRLNLNDCKWIPTGEHRGAHFYTRGQRKGLQIGGKPLPLFIVNTDVQNNRIFVGQGEDHPALFYRGLMVNREEAHWVRPSLIDSSLKSKKLTCQIRYRQAAFPCELIMDSEGSVIVYFSAPHKSVTPGQFVAVFDGNELIFSGAISE
jgi:tRNA-uridine 2-sulfurtransferase